MTFTPRATTGVRPPTDPSVAAQPLLQHFYTQVLISSTKNQKNPKKLLGSMSLFSLSLFYSSPPCSGSSRGLSKTIHFCHVAKSFWHPFSMLIRGQLWIFNMFPGASERQKEDLEWQIIERVCPGKTETKTDKSTKTYVHVSEQERNKST